MPAKTIKTLSPKQKQMAENIEEVSAFDSTNNEADDIANVKGINSTTNNLSQQLDEANARFLEVCERMHELEAENQRLVAENTQLKTKCTDFEEMISVKEDDLLNANILNSSKDDIISKLQSDVDFLKNNPNRHNIVMGSPHGIVGMNGYESWN